MQAFKDGDIRFLICTDVAARGIDISGLPYLINMTLPDRSEDYIHRVGRVGKFSGASVFSLTCQSTSVSLNRHPNFWSNNFGILVLPTEGKLFLVIMPTNCLPTGIQLSFLKCNGL